MIFPVRASQFPGRGEAGLMEGANLLYGVTMEEPGVSKLVSLQFDS